jgi:hypothetical protein
MSIADNAFNETLKRELKKRPHCPDCGTVGGKPGTVCDECHRSIIVRGNV